MKYDFKIVWIVSMKNLMLKVERETLLKVIYFVENVCKHKSGLLLIVTRLPFGNNEGPWME